MKKIILLFIISLLINACGYRALSREEYRKKLLPLTLEPNTDPSVFEVIDTSHVYISYPKREKGYYYSYWKFYSGGQIGLFVSGGTKLNRDTFNPLNAEIGRFRRLTPNAILVEFSMHRRGQSFLNNYTVLIDGDSLKDPKTGETHNVKDKTIPKEWLKGWKPDWK